MILLLGAMNCFAQNSAFKIHSVNVGVGGFYFKKDASEGGGVSGYVQLTSAISKNLISASVKTGAEIGVVGGSNYDFTEVSLQYGREFPITKWFGFEIFAGVGTYSQNSDVDYIFHGNEISFPVTVNSIFKLSPNFGLGLNANYSVNSLNNNFSSHVVLQYKL